MSNILGLIFLLMFTSVVHAADVCAGYFSTFAAALSACQSDPLKASCTGNAVNVHTSVCSASVGYTYGFGLSSGPPLYNQDTRYYAWVGCPSGQVPNTATGICESPSPDTCTPGPIGILSLKYNSAYVSGVTSCDQSCEVLITTGPEFLSETGCYTFPDSATPDQVYCDYSDYKTGATCNSGSSLESSPALGRSFADQAAALAQDDAVAAQAAQVVANNAAAAALTASNAAAAAAAAALASSASGNSSQATIDAATAATAATAAATAYTQAADAANIALAKLADAIIRRESACDIAAASPSSAHTAACSAATASTAAAAAAADVANTAANTAAARKAAAAASAATASGAGSSPTSASGPVTTGSGCGGVGQPVCSSTPTASSNPVTTGSGCGGVGQPACSTTGGCGGPGQPACATTGGSTCGGTGQPACKIDFGSPDDTLTDDSVAEFSNLDMTGVMTKPGEVFDSLLHYSPSIPQGSCPIASWDMFSRTFILDSHCDFVENFRSLLSLTMSFFWLISALFIVLSA